MTYEGSYHGMPKHKEPEMKSQALNEKFIRVVYCILIFGIIFMVLSTSLPYETIYHYWCKYQSRVYLLYPSLTTKAGD